LKRSYKTSGIFNGAEFIIFTALMKQKDELLRNRPGILVSCALAGGTLCEWSRCERKVFELKTV
jgi:hypothetical protein